jgi:VWFA-related protein
MRISESAVVVAALALTASSFTMSAAAEPAPSQSERVVAVEVPVQVIHGGKPVRGLTAENFVLFDQGKPQTITAMDVVDLSRLTQEGGAVVELPTSARRHFLFLFDLTFARASSVVRARRAVQELVATRLHPTDLAGVAVYSAASGFKLLVGFTLDREQVRSAIETLGTPDLIQRSADPLLLTYVEPTLTESQLGGHQTASGAGRAQEVEAHLRSIQGSGRKSLESAQRTYVANFSNDLGKAARLLGTVKGRKYVVLLTESFESSQVFASEDTDDQRQVSRAAEMGEIWEIDSSTRFGSGATRSALDSMLEEFRRADAVIESVEIRPTQESLTEGGGRKKSSGADALFMMANQTGGNLYQRSNDLAELMGTMLEQTSVNYVLFLQPKKLENDGEFHKLRVKLKDVPRGARVSHRAGYYAPREYAQRSATERKLEAASAITAGGSRDELPISLLAMPLQTDSGVARLPVLIEVDGPGLLQGSDDGKVAVEIYVYAFSVGGEVRDFFAHTIRMERDKVVEALSASGLKFSGELELPPGRYDVRALVRNASSGEWGLKTLGIAISDVSASEPSISVPLFPEPRGKWLLVREPQDDAQAQQRPYPFMIGNAPFMPAARPAVQAGRPAEFFVIAFGLGDGPLELRGAVVSPDGTNVDQPTFALAERRPAAVAGSEVIQVRYTPQGLKPGEYRLEFTIVDAAAGEKPSSTTVLVVE